MFANFQSIYKLCHNTHFGSNKSKTFCLNNKTKNKKNMYRKSTSIRHFEQCNQQLPNLICQNCDGSIKILLDVGNQQHAVSL